MIRFFNQGPWGPASGGSNGSGSKGSGGQRPGGGGSFNPNDFEALLRKRQSQFKTVFGGKGGGASGAPNKRFIALMVLVLLGIWASTGFYRINEREQGAVLRFGKWIETVKEPGLHYHIPSPIDSVAIEAVTERRVFKISGARESKYMLTQDLNILDVNMTVHWYIKDLGKYLFRIKNPKKTLEMAAESVLREIVARTSMEAALTRGKDKVSVDVMQLLQRMMDEYEMGVHIERVNLTRVEAPDSVIDAFRDVQSARADQARMINDARGYSDSIVPVARGESEKIVQEATGFRDVVLAEAQGKASRFKQIVTEYKKDPIHTKDRLYLEAMERVYSSVDKVVIPSGQGAQGVLPYLPLEALKHKKNREVDTQASQTQGN